MKARKLKIYVKTDKFSIPIPALRFSTFRWITKTIIRLCPPKIRKNWAPALTENKLGESILKNLTCEDIDQIIDQLELEEPFEMVDVQAEDEKDGKVVVKIYTI
ncbi:MAG: hypothetical protein CVV28_07030 [Methanobacteriales archaeon HGW-Methanobacteriales-1]|jgi:hypothetical protein|nr:MAG: hypothetical protein CVV28_07030 [Methanobacteriales archaeon HGW-Methanobacteriales-1]